MVERLQNDMNIVALIPARGSSKGVKKKNIAKLAGKPLISYSLLAATRSKRINRVIVSTDSKEIARVSKAYGGEVFVRPAVLATDESPVVDTVFSVLDRLAEASYKVDVVVLMQPTSPLRLPADVDGSVELLLEKACDSVISVCKVEHSPYWMLQVQRKYLKPILGSAKYVERRQNLPAVFLPNGAIYASSPSKLQRYHDFLMPKTLPYVMPSERSIDIDTIDDMIMAEHRLRCL